MRNALAAAPVAHGDLIEDVSAAGDAATGQAAGDDLRHRRHVGCDAEGVLRAAGRNAEARDHFIEDEDDAEFGRQRPRAAHALDIDGLGTPVGARRFEDHRGDDAGFFA